MSVVDVYTFILPVDQVERSQNIGLPTTFYLGRGRHERALAIVELRQILRLIEFAQALRVVCFALSFQVGSVVG